MAEVSAKDVAQLRKITGAGMMDCKKALQESGGDQDAAADWLRKQGLGASKRSGRTASQGTVDVVVRMRRPEPPEGRAPPAGQAESIDVARIARRLGEPVVYSGYGVLAREVPRPQQAPTPLPRPSTDLGPHLAYAIQWWGFAVTAFGTWMVKTPFANVASTLSTSTPSGSGISR